MSDFVQGNRSNREKGIADFSHGEKDRKLTKKNVEWYCNRLLKSAHDGLPLDCFLRDLFIRRSAWDKYVSKHKALQVALHDAKARADGAIFDEVFNSGKITSLTQPALIKMIAENQLGWSTKAEGKAMDTTPPIIHFHQADPLPHQLPGADPPNIQQMIVQETGELPKGKKSNGGGNGSGG